MELEGGLEFQGLSIAMKIWIFLLAGVSRMKTFQFPVLFLNRSKHCYGIRSILPTDLNFIMKMVLMIRMKN